MVYILLYIYVYIDICICIVYMYMYSIYALGLILVEQCHKPLIFVLYVSTCLNGLHLP